MTKTLRTLPELHAAGLISANEAQALGAVANRYAIAIPQDVARLIDETDPADPIARQFVPTIAELDHRLDEIDDPIGDEVRSPVRGIVHRYQDRVLLKVVGICPVYCRFCFRREMVGPRHESGLSEADLQTALDYIGEQTGIWEVIISGGDPFVLSPRRIKDLTTRISEIPHVKVIRWHTRMPVVSPCSVTQELSEALSSSRLAIYVAIHANHPRELTDAARAACRRLAGSGLALVSQSVLLKSVNDDPDTLEALMRAFVETGVKPYYLHHPDLAPGTSHFRVPLEAGRALIKQLRRRLSGIAMPTYVLDIPGAHGKVPMGPAYLNGAGTQEGTYTVTDPQGAEHRYRDSC
jgi:lysine 2,3-aminomutase